MKDWLIQWWLPAALGALVILTIVRIRKAWKERREDEELMKL